MRVSGVFAVFGTGRRDVTKESRLWISQPDSLLKTRIAPTSQQPAFCTPDCLQSLAPNESVLAWVLGTQCSAESTPCARPGLGRGAWGEIAAFSTGDPAKPLKVTNL